MIAYSLKEAYAKAVTMCVIERSRRHSVKQISEFLDVSRTQINSFETLKTINLQLLKDYMEFYEIGFSCEIDKL